MTASSTALLVDDDETIGMLTSFILRREGLEVQWIKDGAQALGHVGEADAPALVLLDVMLPGASGYDVLAALRQRPGWDRVPVLMLTGRQDEGEAGRAAAAGADAYIAKPFNPMELAEAVRRMRKGA